jgi:HlyD family secretion protein
MNKNKRKISIGLFLILFILFNLFLIAKKDSPVARTSFITEWHHQSKKYLKVLLPKKGVVTSSEKFYVYFDSKKGNFRQFLISEGSEIQKGEPLFDFEANNVEEQRRKIEREVSRLDGEVKSLENYVSNASNARPAPTDEPNDKKESVDAQKAEDKEIQYESQKDIAEKQLEIDRLKSERDSYSKQLETLSGDLAIVTYNSPYSGLIEDVSYNLDHPIVTIVSDTPAVTGRLTEKEHANTEQDMKVTMKSMNSGKQLSGSVSQVSPFPVKKESVERKSIYDFVVQLNEAKNVKLSPGYHMNMMIVTQEANGALVVAKDAIIHKNNQTFVYVMTSKGTIEKRRITTGLTQKGWIQVTNGLKKGECVVIDPEHKAIFDPSAFITPLKPALLNNHLRAKTNTELMWKYTLLGIFNQ